jgi:hypothetical protein
LTLERDGVEDVADLGPARHLVMHQADIGREQHRAAGAADAQVRARRLQVSIQGFLSMLTQ